VADDRHSLQFRVDRKKMADGRGEKLTVDRKEMADGRGELAVDRKKMVGRPSVEY